MMGYKINDNKSQKSTIFGNKVIARVAARKAKVAVRRPARTEVAIAA